MPPERMKLWTRKFKIKEGQRQADDGAVAPVFPNGWHFGWEGTPGTAWGWTGLAEGGRVILLQVF